MGRDAPAAVVGARISAWLTVRILLDVGCGVRGGSAPSWHHNLGGGVRYWGRMRPSAVWRRPIQGQGPALSRALTVGDALFHDDPTFLRRRAARRPERTSMALTSGLRSRRWCCRDRRTASR